MEESDMAASQNHISVTGNLTRDPELKFSAAGNAFANFSIAWNKNRRNAGGEWESEAHFFDVTCFKHLAEHVAESCQKGTRVTVIGHLEQQRWQDKESGDNRSKVVLIADDVSVDLQFATVQVTKVNKNGAEQASSQLADADPF
jgi:single-strand DNA-binding protein